MFVRCFRVGIVMKLTDGYDGLVHMVGLYKIYGLHVVETHLERVSSPAELANLCVIGG